MPDVQGPAIPEVHAHNALMAVVVALVAIALASLVREPKRQRLMAVVLGGAGGAYLNGGFGLWEFPFAIAVLSCAYRGLQSYTLIGVGWLLHAAWDVLHHWSGLPMLSLFPTSSFECGVCDVILAVWLFAGAPSAFGLFRRRALEQDTPKQAPHLARAASPAPGPSRSADAAPAAEPER
jgi:hypothetical protein